MRLTRVLRLRTMSINALDHPATHTHSVHAMAAAASPELLARTRATVAGSPGPRHHPPFLSSHPSPVALQPAARTRTAGRAPSAPAAPPVSRGRHEGGTSLVCLRGGRRGAHVKLLTPLGRSTTRPRVCILG